MVAAVCAIATACVVATYPRLSHTIDEPVHLGAGVQWLQQGRYTRQTENPPLARVLIALVPYYVGGARLPDEAGKVGGNLFYRSANYVSNVTQARVMTLASFWLVVVLTWAIAGGRRDCWVAALAASMVASVPPLVAHSGFATTDVPFVAALLAAVWAYLRFLKLPTSTRAAAFGLCAGLASATKFSVFGFFPLIAAALLGSLWRDVSPALRKLGWAGALTRLGVATVALLTTIWAAYRFHVGPLAALPTRLVGGEVPTSGWIGAISDWRIPAPEFLHGLLSLRSHTEAGHWSVLFGEVSLHGFWYFYPVTFLAKTPLLFLLATALGLTLTLWAPKSAGRRVALGLALGGLGILVLSSGSPINLGTRHLLVIYPLFFIAAAYGLVRSIERCHAGRRRWALGALVAGLVAHAVVLISWVPDQIGYRNAAVRGEPGYVINDSDLDWGQDLLALRDFVERNQIEELYLLDRGSTNPCKHGFPTLRSLPPGEPVTGWLAVFERPYWLNRGPVRKHPCEMRPTERAPKGWLDWLRSYRPVARVGSGVRVYHIENSDRFEARGERE